MITTTNHQTLLNDEKDNLTPHYHGSALHIPPLITTPTTIHTPTFMDENSRLINDDDNSNNNNNTIQRSLTLNFQSRRPSHQQLSSNPNSIPSATTLNRSASVKVTKYDYPSSTAAIATTTAANYDDDDLDHIQIKRAVSVKRNQNNNQLLKPTITTISRSNSVKSQHRSSLNNDPKRKIEEEKVCKEKKEKDDAESLNETTNSTAGSDTIQIVTVKPTIARIRSLSRKENHKQIPEVENEQADDGKDNEEDKQQQQLLHSRHHERISMPVSTHSTLADGEITVYWQP